MNPTVTVTRPRAASEPPSCWACGAVCPSGTRTALAGWSKREVVIQSVVLIELYCDSCFRMWGFPDVPDTDKDTP